MVAPLSGSLSALGLGMSHSADLAVNQANTKCTVPGYKLVFQPEDDQATPQVVQHRALARCRAIGQQQLAQARFDARPVGMQLGCLEHLDALLVDLAEHVHGPILVVQIDRKF